MRELEAEVLEALRSYVVAYQDASHDFVRHMGLPTTDGLALGEILYAEQWAEPLTPTVLGRRIALTSGAVNALLNRLERGGHVVRSREHDDGRIVTLRATASARARAEEFYAESGRLLGESISSHPDAELVLVRDFLRQYAAILPRARD